MKKAFGRTVKRFLFPAGSVELDHLLGQVLDFDRFAHVQDEEFSALGDGYCLED